MAGIPGDGNFLNLHEGEAAQIADRQQATGYTTAIYNKVPVLPVLDKGFGVNGVQGIGGGQGRCVAGCLLPIGNLSGYALMKAEDVSMAWYIRHIMPKVLLGWLVGLGTYFIVDLWLR